MPDPIMAVSGVSKRYLIYDRPQDRLWQGLFRGRRQFFREYWALQPVTFELQRGETVGIIGPNGSGKSTLLQIVCGTLEPTGGSVTRNGRLAALLELGSGFNPEFTGRENVYFNGTLLGLTRAQIEARFDRIAAFADIGPFIDQPVKTYSSGMAVRLAFAVIAHVDADLLVIDEALAVGDAVFTQKCMRFLRTFQERGTILFVSHDTSAVLNLCQRAIWLQRGTCVDTGPAKRVVEAYVRANIEATQAEILSQAAASAERMPDAGAAPATLPANPTIDDQRPQGEGDSLFSSRAAAFGAQGAVIERIDVIGADGRPDTAFASGERITIRVAVRAHRDLHSPIVGFHFKDRLGQVLFGDNTCDITASAPVPLRAGEGGLASFAFDLPMLRTGRYTLDIAVADGTMADHVQHQWMFDAVVLHVVTDRTIVGLFAPHNGAVTLARLP